MRTSTVPEILSKLLIIMVLVVLPTAVWPQKVVDRSVATVSDGVHTELITYSDLLWQLALQPGTPIDPPSSEDLNRALQTLINQKLFALEAERLPRPAPIPKEIADETNDILSRFASPAEFERRLKRVGFSSVMDDEFIRIISERVAIKKYLDFRFRSFIVVTPADEENYYRTVWVPSFQRRFRGVVVPNLEDKRAEIRSTLIEERVAAQIETFLDEAKRRMSVVILSEV